MPYPIFPVSPLPADLDRTPSWNTDRVRYDSGARQGFSTYARPLWEYDVSFSNMNEVKEAVLVTFIHSVRGMTDPFLMKDPYDFRVNSVVAVRSGITNAATLFLYDTRSYQMRVDTFSIGSLFSSLSGYVRLGVEYGYEQDTGLFTVNTKAATDIWGVRSGEFFRKCAFISDYRERSRLWNQFGATVKIEEIV